MPNATPPYHQSIRWQGYDYSLAGAYFVTICTQDRACLFGEIITDTPRLHDSGNMVTTWWKRIPERFLGVALDAFVLMPNHLHGLILMAEQVRWVDHSAMDGNGPIGDGQSRGGHIGPPLPGDRGGGGGAAQRVSLSDIVGWFKTMTTNEYIRGVKQQAWPAFQGRVWQRTFHDHVVRNDTEFERIRHYILENPKNWALDQENG